MKITVTDEELLVTSHIQNTDESVLNKYRVDNVFFKLRIWTLK